MRCPNCQKEYEPTLEDPSFKTFTLHGSTAYVLLQQNVLCDQCYEVVETLHYSFTADLTEMLAKHTGPGHAPRIAPLSGEQINDAYSIKVQAVCECGELHGEFEGIALPVTKEESRAPWL